MALEGSKILSRYECCHCKEVFCAECDETKQSGQALDGEEGMCFKCRVVNKKPNDDQDDQEPGDPSWIGQQKIYEDTLYLSSMGSGKWDVEVPVALLGTTIGVQYMTY